MGLAITLVFLGLVLLNIKFADVIKAFSEANYWFLIPMVIIMLSDYLIRTLRWQVILNPTKRINFSRLYPVLMIGFMANNLLPARIGEFVRAYTLSSREKVSKTLSLSTIILERVCDGLSLIAFMGVALFFFPSPTKDNTVHYIEIFSTAVFGGAILFLIFLLFAERFTLRLVSLLLRPLPRSIERKAHELLNSFVLGLHALKSFSSVLMIVGTSIIIWSMEASTYYLLLMAFNLQNKLSPMQLIGSALFVLVFVNLGGMIPSSPGYVGVFQGMAVLALGTYGVNQSTSFGVGLLMNFTQYFFITAIGLFFFSKQNMSLKALRESSQIEKQALEIQAGDEPVQEPVAQTTTPQPKEKSTSEMVAADS